MTPRPRWRYATARSAAVVVVAAAAVPVLLSGLATAAPAPAAPAPAPVSDAFPAPPVAWGPCDPDDFATVVADGSSVVPPDFRCAVYEVPLDYDDPTGPLIALSLVLNPADDPDADGRALFVNPGGPGGSGVDTVVDTGDALFGPEVHAAFDVIGFDPRGVARSTALQCYEDNDAFLAADDARELRAPWPETDAEFAAAERDADAQAAACAERAGPIIDHMGTTNVARDLDVLRRAEGDADLNFVGFSYGTYICAQYLTQYADRAGAVVCDANIDPVEYATGEGRDERVPQPMFARSRTEVGTNATLEQFFRLCDEGGPANCAFAPNSQTRFDALSRRLAEAPLDLGGGSVLDDRQLVALSLGQLYNSQFGFPVLASIYAEIERLAAGGAPAPAAPAPGPTIAPPVNEAYFNAEALLGVSCSDNLQPDDYAAWRAAIERSEGRFGPLWASGDLGCASWPGEDTDTVLGPFDRATPHPVLIVNSRYDAATPYEDAEDTRNRLPNSALLTVEGWGHVGTFLSQCSIDVVDRYLLTRTVAERSLSCVQDVRPFRGATAPAVPPAGEETIPEPVLEAAADAALAEVTEGDPADVRGTAADAVVTGLEEAGRTELADSIRAQEAVLRQSQVGLPGGG